MTELNIALAIAKIQKYIKKHSVTVSQCYDFDEFEAFYTAMRGQKPSGQFLQDNFDFIPENSFWVKLTRKNKIMCAYGVRLDVLGETSLGTYWRQQERVYKNGGLIGHAHSPGALKIFGKVVYTGEAYAAKEIRGHNLTAIAIQLGLLVAYAKWQYNYIYCFMSPELVASGFGSRCGYLTQEPSGVDWQRTPEGISRNDYFCYTSGDQIKSVAQSIAKNRQLKWLKD